jgi:hypothetical protein
MGLAIPVPNPARVFGAITLWDQSAKYILPQGGGLLGTESKGGSWRENRPPTGSHLAASYGIFCRRVRSMVLPLVHLKVVIVI